MVIHVKFWIPQKTVPKSSSPSSILIFCCMQKVYNVGDIIIKKRIVGRTPVDDHGGALCLLRLLRLFTLGTHRPLSISNSFQ